MKRILYVSDAKSIHTQRWAKHFYNQGLEVHIASFRYETIENVTVHQLPKLGSSKIGYLLAIPFLRKLGKKLKPEIVHAQYVTSYGFLAAAANLKPLIITAWGTDVLISPQQSWLMKKLVQYALRKADKITTVATHMNESISELGIKKDSIIAVPFGVDTDLFHLPDHKPSSNTLRIISTRNFAEIYSIHTIIEALHKIINQGHNIHLDLVGKGHLRKDLERLVLQLNLVNNVTFHGHISHTELVNLLGNSHIFISSALSDGNNISLNEAMACGCFPIATNIPANSQWITHNNNGLLYSKGNSNELSNMLILATDEKLRSKSRLINRKIVEDKASWANCTSIMHDIYNNLQKENSNNVK